MSRILHLLAVWCPGAQSARDNYLVATLPNVHRFKKNHRLIQQKKTFQDVVGSLITTLLQIYCRISGSSERIFENRLLRFYNLTAMSLVCGVLAYACDSSSL